MKLLMFDFRETEKNIFNTDEYKDFEITTFEGALNDKTKLSDEEYKNTCILSVYRSSLLTKEVLKKFKNLRVIATRSYIFNHIDLDYCKKNKIAVLNVSQYGEEAIAEYAIGLIIALERKIKPALDDIKGYNINPIKYEGRLLNNLTIGIIGCGKVGVKLGKIADFFNMKVLVSSYKEAPNFESYCNIVPFDELLSKSDIIALHMPYTTETYQIIGEEEFDKMKNGVYIINTSCIELINIQALYKNLLNGKVLGAGMDILDSDFTKTKTKELGNETMSTINNSKMHQRNDRYK